MKPVSDTLPAIAPPGPSTAAPAAPPLLQRLVDLQHGTWLADADVDDWLQRAGLRVLLLAGDPVRFPEGLDVAVVLPELVRGCSEPVAIGVARAADEAAIARRFGSQRWPSLVFVRDGRYLATLSGMHDWDVFVRRFDDARHSPPARVPGVGIAVVAAGQPSGCA